MPVREKYYGYPSYDGSWRNVPSDGTVGSCCGSRYLPAKTNPKKWKNAHGEGITKGGITNPITANTKGILLVDGLVGEEGTHDKTVVKHLETKNGPITISIRKVW